MNIVPQHAQDAIEKMIHEDEGGWVFTDRKDDSGGATYGGMTWRTFEKWLQPKIESGEIPVDEHGFTAQDFAEAANAVTIENKVLRKFIIECYYNLFWLDCHIEEVPQFAQAMFFSTCVNMGKKEATKCLQKAYNNEFKSAVLVVDGHFGPRTADAMDQAELTIDTIKTEWQREKSIASFKLAFSDACMERYIRIVQRNAREWRSFVGTLANWQNAEYLSDKPKTLQSENLMGWFNRARKYRSM